MCVNVGTVRRTSEFILRSPNIMMRTSCLIYMMYGVHVLLAVRGSYTTSAILQDGTSGVRGVHALQGRPDAEEWAAVSLAFSL
jgi:hypothetical protein